MPVPAHGGEIDPAVVDTCPIDEPPPPHEPMSLAASVSRRGYGAEDDDLELFLKDVHFGVEGDRQWTPPSSYEQEYFALALGELLDGRLSAAVQAAREANLELVEFRDAQRGLYYMLREPRNASRSYPRGIYVYRPGASSSMVVEVPHPRTDTRTNWQGIELFLDGDASLLLLSGTHRRSDTTQSICDGSSSNDYRRSDPAHAVEHLFHAAHVTAEAYIPGALFIQLHGVGASGTELLAGQCGVEPEADDNYYLFNVSDGLNVGNSGISPVAGSPAYELVERARTMLPTANGNLISGCLYNRDTENYGGTLNTQGRVTNGSDDACHEHAPVSEGSSYENFLHIEQSYEVRTNAAERAAMNQLIIETVAAYEGGSAAWLGSTESHGHR
ncbi:hypothetical protein [Haliangium ochraceum]|uniref:hypothetical protein n=1 Tax=Haliangium ochraceum TaxID=80816 RepID=UPI001269E678|nr:hypothetical protein [Haliangium ochraceum]